MLEYVDNIKDIADSRIVEFNSLGHAVAGHNGPYFNTDTPVRNTSHWLIIYGYLYEKYQDEKYLDLVLLFAEYLIKNDNYGISGAVICRTDKNVDDTNGLIGQAWVIEALIYAYQLLNNKSYYEKAVCIFLSQDFDDKMSLWKIVKSDGCNTGFDFVYNHQLWFAAAGKLILDAKYHQQIDDKIRAFLDNFKTTFGVQPSGLIFHLINHKATLVNKFKFMIKMLLSDLKLNKKYKDLTYLEKGYHLFNLFGFALLYDRYSDMEIFNSIRYKRALKYGLSKKTIEKLGNNERNFNVYSYAYNSPAFEYPFISAVFNYNSDETLYKELLEIQDNLTFSDSEKMYCKNNLDSETLTARLYELVRYYQHLKCRLR